MFTWDTISEVLILFDDLRSLFLDLACLYFFFQQWFFFLLVFSPFGLEPIGFRIFQKNPLALMPYSPQIYESYLLFNQLFQFVKVLLTLSSCLCVHSAGCDKYVHFSNHLHFPNRWALNIFISSISYSELIALTFFYGLAPSLPDVLFLNISNTTCMHYTQTMLT